MRTYISSHPCVEFKYKDVIRAVNVEDEGDMITSGLGLESRDRLRPHDHLPLRVVELADELEVLYLNVPYHADSFTVSRTRIRGNRRLELAQ